MGKLIKKNNAEKDVKIFLSTTTASDYIIQKAKQQAQRIIYEAQKEAEQNKEIIKQQALDEAKAESMCLIIKANQYEESIKKDQEKDIISLAVNLAEKIVNRSIQLEPIVLVSLYQKAVEEVKNARKIIIKVNPDDIDLIKKKYPEIYDNLLSTSSVEIRPDMEIERNGCIVESSIGNIDARLSTQFDLLRKKLLGENNEE